MSRAFVLDTGVAAGQGLNPPPLSTNVKTVALNNGCLGDRRDEPLKI